MIYTGCRFRWLDHRLSHVFQHSLWVERKQSTLAPVRNYDSPGESRFSHGAIQRGEVLLADGIHPSSLWTLKSVSIGCLQRRKDGDITGLAGVP